MTVTNERWAFTQAELAAPAECKSHDELIAGVPYEYAEERGIECGIIVYRNGTVSNRWEDGTAGVSVEAAELAGEDELPYSPDSGELADTWRDVTVDDAGNFLAFA
jgi:hypothetical protein